MALVQPCAGWGLGGARRRGDRGLLRVLGGGMLCGVASRARKLGRQTLVAVVHVASRRQWLEAPRWILPGFDGRAAAARAADRIRIGSEPRPRPACYPSLSLER